MQTLFTFAFLLLASNIYAPSIAYADSMTIGGITFDFDAPAPPLTTEQQSFFEKYKDAVNRHDEAALTALEDDSRKTCAFLDRQTIEKDLKNTIPDNAKIKFFEVSKDISKEFGLGKSIYASTQPTHVLGINSNKGSILRSVRQTGDTLTLVPYCLTEQGKADLEKNKQSQP